MRMVMVANFIMIVAAKRIQDLAVDEQGGILTLMIGLGPVLDPKGPL